MTDLNLSTNLGGVSGSGYVAPPASSETTPTTAPSDDISTSEQIAVLMAMFSPSNPILVPPALVIDKVSSLENDAVNALLDKWIEDIRIAAKRAEDEALSPNSYRNRQNDAYKSDTERDTLVAMDLAVRVTPEYQDYRNGVNQKVTFLTDLANGMEGVRREGSGAGAVMVAMVLFTDATGGPVTINNIDNQTSPSKLSFQLMAEQAAMSVPNAQDVAAQMGYIGALFMLPAIMQAEMVCQADKGSKEPALKDWKFAQAYDGAIREKIKGKEIEAWIKGMVLGHLPRSDISPEHLIAMGKAILLSSALALYYRVETSHMTGQEFLDMLDGKVKFDRPDDPRYELIKMINSYLDQLPKSDRDNIKGALASYMETNPKLEEMIKPVPLFSGVLHRMEEGAHVESPEIAV